MDLLYDIPARSSSLQHELPPYCYRPTSRSTIHTLPEADLSEFSCDLFDSKHKPWLTLTTLGDMNLSQSIPTIMEGTKITGSVKVSLERPRTVKSVILSVRGRLVTGGDTQRVFTFLNQPVTIWSSDDELTSRDTKGTTLERGASKLKGTHCWEFSVTLPPYVTLPAGQGKSTVFRLPHTFFEPPTRASVQYEVVVRVCRGKMKRDNKLRTSIGYFHDSRPGPSSQLRQLAMQLNSPPLGPEMDPDGWQALKPVYVRGTLFSSRKVSLKCTLFLAKPLCYTRGSSIPCALTIETPDYQALDHLCRPKSIVVRLQRHVRYSISEFGTDLRAGRKKLDVFRIQQAFWRKTPQEEHPPNCCVLRGEIPLRRDLNPSFSIASLSVEYQVGLFPFRAVGFKPSTDDTIALLSHPVEIVTNFETCPPVYSST